MTLHLVTNDDQALPCRYTCGGQNPAIMLLSLNGQPALPCCDRCARAYYDLHPDMVQMGPLDGYVDMFAAAKEAALATPEQITGSPAPETAERAAEHGKLPHPATVCILVAAPIISLLGGSFMGSQAGGSFLLGLIVFIILLPVTIGLGFLAKALITDTKHEARQNATLRQQYAAGSYQGAPQQGRSVPWYQHPDVVNAAIVGGVAIAAHEATKRQKARVRDSALGRAPLNNAAAGMNYGTYLAGRPDDTQDGIRYELEQLNTANPKWTRR